MTIDDIIGLPDVIRVSNYPKIRMLSYDSLIAHYSTTINITSTITSNTYGTGILIAIADTSIDPFHQAFYDPSQPNPVQGVLTPGTHTKIASWITAIPGVTGFIGINGAHGTATSGEAAGFQGVGEQGISPAARFMFYEITPNDNDETLDIPNTFFTWLSDACAIGATVFTGSWGSTDTTGIYDDMSEMIDELALANPYCSITFACGNSGPTGLCSSPSNGKNVDAIGASFSNPEAYNDLWSDSLIHPSRYTSQQVSLCHARSRPLLTSQQAVDFSSTGPTIDGRRSPLFYSSGVAEWVPYSFTIPTANHAQYTRMYGTSFSTPSIAGIKAYFQSKYKSTHDGIIPSASLVSAWLISITIPMLGVQSLDIDTGATPLLDAPTITGFGFPVVNATIPLTGGIEGNLTEREGITYISSSTVVESIMVGIVWHDQTNGGLIPSLINDLDIRVFMNGLQIHPPYTDNINPNERISISSIPFSSTIRFVVYEKDNTIQGGDNVPFGFYLSGGSTIPTTVNVGTCFSNEINACVGGTTYQTCNGTSGLFSGPCLTPCNGTTITMEWGSECLCIYGTERSCGVGGYQVCEISGIFPSVCSYDTQENSVPEVSEQSESNSYDLSLSIFIVIIILHLVTTFN